MNDNSKIFFGPRFKLIYSIVQMILFYTAINLFPNYDLLCLLIVVLTFLIPLYINSYLIKFKDRETKLSVYIFEDVIYYYLPSIAASIIIELILYFVGLSGKLVCFFTVVLFIIFTLLMLFQWLRYFIQYKMTRNQNDN